MTKKEYNEWLKQYYKFKNNNLPTPYWNEGNNFEYVGTKATINPFQAYFVSEIAPNNFNSKLKIIILHETSSCPIPSGWRGTSSTRR